MKKYKLAALGYIFSLFFGWSGYIVFLKAKDDYTKFHGFQAFLVGIIVSAIGVAVILFPTIFLFPTSLTEIMSFLRNLLYIDTLIGIVYIVISIWLAILAYRGHFFKVPLIGNYCERFIKRFEAMKKSKKIFPFSYIRTVRGLFFYILLVVILVTTFLIIPTYYYKPDVSECENRPTLTMKASCIARHAVNENDFSLCYLIDDVEERDFCFLRFARSTGNIAVCDLMMNKKIICPTCTEDSDCQFVGGYIYRYNNKTYGSCECVPTYIIEHGELIAEVNATCGPPTCKCINNTCVHIL